MKSFLNKLPKMQWITALAGVFLAVSPHGAFAQLATPTTISQATQGLLCADDRKNQNYTCSSGEFAENVQVVQATPISCVVGTTITISVQTPLSGVNTNRYQGALFVGENANDPTQPGGTCSVKAFPTASGSGTGFANNDGDSCGDFNGGGVEEWRIDNIKVTCQSSPTGNLLVPYLLAYSQNSNSQCNAANPDASLGISPGNPSKCDKGNVVVPTITVNGFVKITKKTSPAAASQSFTFAASSAQPGVTPASFQLTDGQSQIVEAPLTNGNNSITITESLAASWDPTASIVCKDAAGGDASSYVTINNENRTLTANFSVASGQTSAICEITNTQKPPVMTTRKELVDESIATDDIAQPGELLTYAIAATNAPDSGPQTDYEFYEVIPANTTLKFIMGGGVTFSGCTVDVPGTQNCLIKIAGPINGGTSGVVQVGVLVDNPIAAGVTAINNLITDNATLPTTSCTPTTTGDHCVSTPVEAAKIAVTKTLFSESGGSQAGFAEPNETLVYRLIATNSGGASAANFSFYDVLPANTTFASISANATTDCVLGDAGAKLCKITVAGPVAGGGGTATIDFGVKVIAQIPTGVTDIRNLVTNDTTTTPPLTPCPSASSQCVITPISAPVIASKKALTAETGGTRSGFAEPNEALTYTITVTNSGGSSASNVQFYDVLPANTTFMSIAGATTDCVTGNPGARPCKITVAGPIQGSGGTATVSFTVKVIPQIPSGVTAIHNLVTDDAMTSPATTPCAPSSDHCVITPVSAPVITTQKVLTTETGGTQAGIAEPNETFTYTITATNSGGASASNVEFYDVLPANTTFVSTAGATTDCVAGDAGAKLCKITVAGPIQGSGGTAAVSFVVKVAAQLPAGVTNIHNLVTNNTTTTPPLTPCPSATPQCVITPVSTPLITTAKKIHLESGNKAGIAEPGEQLTYQITVTNRGGASASNVSFYDVLPANTKFVSVSGVTVAGCVSGDVGAKNCTLTVAGPILGSGGFVNVDFVVMVVDPIPSGVTKISNLVTDNTVTPPGDCVPTDTNHCVEIPVAAPQVSVVKALTAESGSKTQIAEPGERLTYTITVTNTGGSDAANHAFFEVIPANSTLVSIAGATSSCAAGTAGGTTCTLTIANVSTTAPSTLTVIVDVANPIPPGVSKISNLVTDNTVTPPGDCVPSDTNHCVEIPVAAPQVSVVKALTGESGSKTQIAEPGERLTYTITVTNTGGSDAANHAFFEVIPANSTLVSIAGATSSCAAGTAGGTTCTLTIANVSTTAPSTVTVIVDVANPIPSGVTKISNLVTDNTVTPPGDCVPSDTNHCVEIPVAAPQVSVVKALTAESGSKTQIAEPGERLTYTITVTNTGGSDAANHAFFEVIPTNTTLVSVAGASTTCAAGADGGTTCTLTIANVSTTAPSTVTVIVDVANPIPAGVTKISNLVTDNTVNPPGDCVPSDTNHCVEIPVAAPQVSVVKALTGESGSKTQIAEPGERLTYTITVTNTGGSDAANHAFFEVIPTNTTLVSVAGASTTCAAGTAGGTTCTLTIANVSTTAPSTVTVIVDVANPIPAGVTKISNLVTDNTVTPPGDCVPSDTNHRVEIPVAAPQVSVVKALTAESGSKTQIAEPGERLTYTITVTNTGGSDAANHAFFEVIPANSTLVSIAGATSSCAAGTAGGTTCTLTIANVSTTAPSTLTVIVDVANPIPAGVTKISNLVTDNTLTPPGDCVPSDTNHCVEIPVAAPQVSVVKALTGESGSKTQIAELGERLTYTITVTNTGGSDAANHAFFEVIPANSTLVSIAGATSSCAAGTAGGTTCTLTIANVSTTAPSTVTVIVDVANPIPSGVTKISNLVTDNTVTPPGDCVPSDTNHCVEIPVAAPQVSVVKALTAESGSKTQIAEPGERLTYTITVTNTGGSDAANHAFFEVIPANSTLVSIAGATSSCAAGTAGGTTCTLTIANVSTTAPSTLTVIVDVANPIPAGVTKISNLVTDNTLTPPGDCVPSDTNHCVEIPVAAPQVSVVKALTGESGSKTQIAELGERLTYTITVTNTGGSDAANHAFFEVIPANTTLVSVAGASTTCAAGTSGGTTCTLTVANVSTTTPSTVTVIVDVANPIPAGVTKISNLVTDNTVNPPGDCVPSDTNHCVEIPVEPASITTSKKLTAESGTKANIAEAGETLTYTITVTNSGGASAGNVKFYDVLPANTTFASIGDTATTDCTTADKGAKNCAITMKNPIAGNGGVATVTFAVKVVSPIPTGVIAINNLVTDKLEPPSVTCDADSTSEHCVSTPVEKPSTMIAKTLQSGGPEATPNGLLIYALKVTNTSGTSALIPAGAIMESVPAQTIAQGNDDFTCAVNAAAGTKCGNKAEVVVPGFGSVTLLFKVKVVAQPTPGTKTISNVVVPPDGMTCDDKDLCTEVTPLRQNPPVAVDDNKRADTAGQVITLSASANDSDPDGDLNVESISIGGGDSIPTVWGSARPVDTDQDGDFDQLTVPGEGKWVISNNGDATFTPQAGFTGDPTPLPYTIKDFSGLTSNVAKITIVYPRLPAQLYVQKIGSTRVAEVGDIVTYTVTVKNTGQVAATPAVMVDRLPAGFLLVDKVTLVQGAKMVSITGAPGPVINVTLDTLVPGATATVIYRVRVGVGAQEGDGINRVHMECPRSTAPGVCSNQSEWKVRVEGGVFTNDGCVVGQVFVDCNWNSVKDRGELGIPGVRLYMEDGTYFITDVEGKYSYCGLRPTTHGIKVDSKSMPEKSRLITSSNRNTGDAESIFVDLKNGEMQRADFIEGSCTPELIQQVENRINGSGPRIDDAKRAPVKFENKPAN